MITGSEIMKALEKDPRFVKNSPAVLAQIQPFIEALAQLPKELLESPVSLQSIFDTRIALVLSFVRAGRFDVDPTVLGQTMIYAANVPGMLAKAGITEEEAIRKSFNLEPGVLNSYLTGKMTIEELLAKQPGVIVFDF
jgi:hypothetical protein